MIASNYYYKLPFTQVMFFLCGAYRENFKLEKVLAWLLVLFDNT